MKQMHVTDTKLVQSLGTQQLFPHSFPSHEAAFDIFIQIITNKLILPMKPSDIKILIKSTDVFNISLRNLGICCKFLIAIIQSVERTGTYIYITRQCEENPKRGKYTEQQKKCNSISHF